MIRSLANGNVIDASEEAAKQLMDAGIYERADSVPGVEGEAEPRAAEQKLKRRKTR